MSDRNHFLEGVVFGAVVGAVAALLFAPQSGAETRRKLKKFKDSQGPLIQNTKEKTEEMISKTMNAIESGFDRIGKMVDKRQKNGEFEEFHG
ncbi:YtxH domain-containing protein [bacterium]|nr:YtxH domain-containing protein [bacterium]